MAKERDLSEIVAGEDETYGLTITENGSAKDVSTWSFEMVIRQDNARDVEIGSANVDDSNAANGEVNIQLTSENSSKLEENNHDYKIVATKGNGDKSVLLYGQIPVEVI